MFSCGTFVFGEGLYIVYGGGDTYILAAETNLAMLIEHPDERVDPDLALSTPSQRIRSGWETALNLPEVE